MKYPASILSCALLLVFQLLAVSCDLQTERRVEAVSSRISTMVGQAEYEKAKKRVMAFLKSLKHEDALEAARNAYDHELEKQQLIRNYVNVPAEKKRVVAEQLVRLHDKDIATDIYSEIIKTGLINRFVNFSLVEEKVADNGILALIKVEYPDREHSYSPEPGINVKEGLIKVSYNCQADAIDGKNGFIHEIEVLSRF